MTRLVDRFGRMGFAALLSLIWAIPMAAWAGSADLSPIDRTAYPWIALAIGLAMLIVWLALISRLGAIKVTDRQRRFDLSQMTPKEKRWTLATIVFGTGLIALLNAAATVDWAPMASAVRQDKPGPIALGAGLGAFVLVMLAGIALSWRRASAAFLERRSQS